MRIYLPSPALPRRPPSPTENHAASGDSRTHSNVRRAFFAAHRGLSANREIFDLHAGVVGPKPKETDLLSFDFTRRSATGRARRPVVTFLGNRYRLVRFSQRDAPPLPRARSLGRTGGWPSNRGIRACLSRIPNPDAPFGARERQVERLASILFRVNAPP